MAQNMLLEVVPGLLLGDRTTALRGELLLQNGVKILIFSHLPASPEHCQRFLRQAKPGQVSLVFLPGEPGGQCRWRFQPPPALLHQPDQHAAEGQQQGQLPWAYRPGGPEHRGRIRSKEKGSAHLSKSGNSGLIFSLRILRHRCLFTARPAYLGLLQS